MRLVRFVWGNAGVRLRLRTRWRQRGFVWPQPLLDHLQCLRAKSDTVVIAPDIGHINPNLEAKDFASALPFAAGRPLVAIHRSEF